MTSSGGHYIEHESGPASSTSSPYYLKDHVYDFEPTVIFQCDYLNEWKENVQTLKINNDLRSSHGI